MEYIERDQCEYTLDDEDRRVQDVILKPDPDATVLKKTLSCSYPNLPFNEAIQKENEKLQLELQRSQACMDVGQCEVIQHLLDFTESVAVTSLSQKNSSPEIQKTWIIVIQMLTVIRRVHTTKAILRKVGLNRLQGLFFYLSVSGV